MTILTSNRILLFRRQERKAEVAYKEFHRKKWLQEREEIEAKQAILEGQRREKIFTQRLQEKQLLDQRLQESNDDYKVGQAELQKVLNEKYSKLEKNLETHALEKVTIINHLCLKQIKSVICD